MKRPSRRSGNPKWTSVPFLVLVATVLLLANPGTRGLTFGPKAAWADSGPIAATFVESTLWPLPAPTLPSAKGWMAEAIALSFSELSMQSQPTWQPGGPSSPRTPLDAPPAVPVLAPVPDTPTQTQVAPAPSPSATRAGKTPATAWNTLVQAEDQHALVPRLTIGWVLDTGTADLESILKQTPGLSVLAPKWLHVDGPSGSLTDTIEPAVVAAAHRLGIKVWAVVDNGFDGPLTHQFLQYQDTQHRLIAHLVQIARRDDLDGINLDFEGLQNIDRWNYARFVEHLGQRLHALHKSLSVDLPPDYVSGDNSGPYNHASLAEAATYVILMGYDQYWGGDSTAGPTASLPWVEASVADMIHTGVPADKLILGVPFYTQAWTLDQSGQVTASQALSLWQVRQLLSEQHIKTVWEPHLGLRFGRYRSGGQVHEIWVEDNRSLLLTLSLVPDEHLAGAAAWYLGLEYPSTWLSLIDSVRSAIA